MVEGKYWLGGCTADLKPVEPVDVVESVVRVGSEPITTLTCVVAWIISVVEIVTSPDLAIVNWGGAVDSDEVDD